MFRNITTMFESVQDKTDQKKQLVDRKGKTMNIKNIMLTAFAIFGLAMLTTPATQAQTCDGTGVNFIDLDGDGFNDNAPDHDGDGIPNGLDADYVKNAQDGTGYQKGKLGENRGQGMGKNMSMSQRFERLQASNGNMFQKRIGAMSGMTTFGTGICDGTGEGTAGTGVCDGTGPNGRQNRGGR